MKAIAIVDLPDDAFEWGDGEWIIDDAGAIRYLEDNAWVHFKDIKYFPLKPMPEKRKLDATVKFDGYDNIIQSALMRGYNACIDEILAGETE